MLVISRKPRQRIYIGDSIVITVVRAAGDRVRLGIEAPSDVRILREELIEAEPPVFEASELSDAMIRPTAH